MNKFLKDNFDRSKELAGRLYKKAFRALPITEDDHSIQETEVDEYTKIIAYQGMADVTELSYLIEASEKATGHEIQCLREQLEQHRKIIFDIQVLLFNYNLFNNHPTEVLQEFLYTAETIIDEGKHHLSYYHTDDEYITRFKELIQEHEMELPEDLIPKE